MELDELSELVSLEDELELFELSELVDPVSEPVVLAEFESVPVPVVPVPVPVLVVPVPGLFVPLGLAVAVPEAELSPPPLVSAPVPAPLASGWEPAPVPASD